MGMKGNGCLRLPTAGGVGDGCVCMCVMCAWCVLSFRLAAFFHLHPLILSPSDTHPTNSGGDTEEDSPRCCWSPEWFATAAPSFSSSCTEGDGEVSSSSATGALTGDADGALVCWGDGWMAE